MQSYTGGSAPDANSSTIGHLQISRNRSSHERMRACVACGNTSSPGTFLVEAAYRICTFSDSRLSRWTIIHWCGSFSIKLLQSSNGKNILTFVIFLMHLRNAPVRSFCTFQGAIFALAMLCSSIMLFQLICLFILLSLL